MPSVQEEHQNMIETHPNESDKDGPAQQADHAKCPNAGRASNMTETHHIEGGQDGLVQQLAVAGLAARLFCGKVASACLQGVVASITLNQHLHSAAQHTLVSDTLWETASNEHVAVWFHVVLKSLLGKVILPHHTLSAHMKLLLGKVILPASHLISPYSLRPCTALVRSLSGEADLWCKHGWKS